VLPNQNRLRRREDFAKVYAKGDRYRGTYLNLRILFDANDPLTRIGLVVSKKVSKLAVTRNRFKRQLRAIFRQLLSQLNDGLQIVVTVTVVQGKPSYQELWDDLKNLLARAKVLHGS
jgi:ribonuclease P protein component